MLCCASSYTSKLTVSNNNLTISGSEWGTALMQHTGITHGKHCWSVKIDRKASSGGICVGVVDVERFNPSLHTIGADTNSWGYSSLGVKGDGSGEWLTFGSKFGKCALGMVTVMMAGADVVWLYCVLCGRHWRHHFSPTRHGCRHLVVFKEWQPSGR